MGDVVDLHGQPAGLEDDPDFISDLARFAEGIFSEQDVKKKHHLSADTWERLGNNETLIEKIEAEKVRRVRTGDSKGERSQQLVMKAPNILDSIMSDPAAFRGTGSMQSKHWMRLPATDRKPRRRRIGFKLSSI